MKSIHGNEGMMQVTVFKNLSETSRIMAKWIFIQLFIFSAIGAVAIYLINSATGIMAENVLRVIVTYIAGVFFGGIFSFLKLVLMERALDKSADMQGGRSAGYAASQYMLRYLLTIAVLIVPLFFKTVFNFFGVIVGILTLQFSAYFAGFEIKKKYPMKDKVK